MKKIYFIFAFLPFLLCCTISSYGQETGVIYPTEFKVTKPLRDLVKEHPFVEPDFDAEIWVSPDRKNRPPQTFVFSAEDGPEYGNDPSIIQTVMGKREISQNKAILQNFAGASSSSYPPDPTGAVGPSHYVQMVNATTVRIFNKTGTALMSFQLGTLWGLSSNAGDPIVMYDKFADRWFLSQFGSSNQIYIAISQTNDPTGSYYTWTYNSPQFPDYLKFSIWHDGYYMTSNQTTDKVYVFERSVMLTGGSGARGIYSTFTTGSVSAFFIPLPADAADNATLPPSGTPFPFFAYYDNAWGGGTDGVKIWNMTTNWTSGSATISAATQVNTDAFDASYNSSWNDCPQPNGQYLDGIGGVIMYRVPWRSWSGYNNVVLTWGVLISNSPRQRAIYWCELRQISGTWSVYQQGIYAPDAATRWMSSAAMDDNGNIALCYAKSSTSIYPGLYYTGRCSGDPLGTMTFTETTAIAGTGSQSSYNRYGDYSHTSLDPDGVTFWHTGEYVSSASGQETRVYSFQLPCAVAPIASVSIAITSGTNPTCAGTPVTFTATPVNGGTAPTYQWYNNGTAISGATNAAYSSSGLANGNIITCVMTSNLSGVIGSPATSNAITMTVNAIPATPSPSSNTPVCVGSTINLSTPAVTGATYSWTGPNSFTSTSQNPTISNAAAANAGTYSVTVTVSGCISSAGTTTVVVNSVPSTPTAGSNSPVCAGSTINLTTPTLSGATYNWTGPNSFTSTLQNPSITNATTAMAGTYSVTRTVAGCASAAGTTTVVVNALPATPTVSSNSPVCTGTTINLSTPAVSGATYNWTGPNSFTSTLQNPSISNASSANAGTYSVTVTVAGCTSLAGTTAVVVSAPPSTPTPGSNSPVCAGGTINLTTPTVSGATYSWTGPNSFTSSLQNPSISNATLAMAGNYSVTVAFSGCTSAAGTTNVSVVSGPATPTASSNSPICAGSTLMLSTPTVTGATYNWTGPNSFTSTLQNPIITNVTTANAGTYSVTITQGGCPSLAGNVSVVINPLPSTPAPSSNSPVCVGGTINLSTPTVSGASYNWSGPNSFSSNLQNPSISGANASMAGTYYLDITVAGCKSPAGSTSVVVSNPPATPSASSNSPVCAGATITLSTPTVSGASYSWTGPNSFTSSSQNPSISGATTAQAGDYSVTISVSGCVSTAGTTTVVVNALPAAPSASSNSPVCAGATINLSTPLISGATYNWTGPNSFTSTLQNPAITNASSANAGTYSVTVTVGGCTSPAVNTTVSLSSPAIADFTATPTTTSCSGFVQFTDNTSGTPISWLWNFGDGQTSTLQNPSHNYNVSGVYSVSLTATNACGSNQATKTDYLTIDVASLPVVVGGSNCGPASINLSASGAGTLNWYDAATGGNLLATGTTYTTPYLTTTTNYYVESQLGGATVYTGRTNKTNTGNYNISGQHGLIFDAYQPFILKSIKVYSYASGTNNRTFSLLNASNGTISSVTAAVPNGESRVTLNLNVPAGTGLKLVVPGYSYLWRDQSSTANIFPFTVPDVLSIITTTASTNPLRYYYYFYDWEVELPGCTSDRSEVTAAIYASPLAEAGNAATYSGTPIPIGSASNGPGIISWLPVSGLDNATAAQPLASPSLTTTYTVTVDNYGCIATDTVTITKGNTGFTINGKTRYLEKAYAGNPAPNLPTYGTMIYNIDQVIVVLKDGSGNELARDTSDAAGNFQFTNVNNGNYILSYDKYTADTMQTSNDINAIDVAILKYYVGHNPTLDPSRDFSSIHKKAADVDNNATVNAVDIGRLRAKIGQPYLPLANYPKGNWPELNTNITVAGTDLSIVLGVVSYGDYNASSNKYLDSLYTWNMAKSLPVNIIHNSDESININNSNVFDIPLRISSKMVDLAALGLELKYPDKEFKLVGVSMPNNSKSGNVVINPPMDEIIANDNDLLVTDIDGVIRVVFATTDFFSVAPKDELIRFSFRSENRLKPGALDFTLAGTGVIGNQYGEEDDNAYLLMPRIYVQGNNSDEGFEFTGYPNPFTNDVTLTYNIPDKGSVKLSVYNALGEIVSDLVNENKPGGKHSVVFTQKDLPSGLYTFKLEFSGIEKEKTMILKLIH